MDYRRLREILPELTHGHFGVPADEAGTAAAAAALERARAAAAHLRDTAKTARCVPCL